MSTPALSVNAILLRAWFRPVPKTWDEGILRLARGLKFEAGLAGQSWDDLKPIVSEWYEKMVGSLWELPFSVVWSKFQYSWRQARVPLTEDPILHALVCATVKPPRVPAWIHDDYSRLIYRVLLRLSEQDGGRFFASCRKLGQYLETSHETARSRMKKLLAAGVIELAEVHTPSRATRYLWRGDTPGRASDGAV